MKIFSNSLFVFAVLAFVSRAGAEVTATNEVLPGVRIYSETRTNPPTHLFVAEVDLKNPKLHLRVSRGGPDPDGPGIWQTTLLQPTKIAGREKFDFVMNGDFFIAKGVNDGEGTNAAFRAEQWARVEGPAMTDGETWSIATNARPALVVHKDHSVTIETMKQPAKDDWEVIAGNVILVKDGAVVPHKSAARHPRTLAGLDATGNKLILMLVDGRKPGVAIGMTYDEEAAEMLRLGCAEALNLDGGGSSVMAVREAGELKILNEPTDGRERAVGNVLGISVDQN
ncbi:MAG TPA: phosphodiester glycosidase family protein [Candidatus Acidoferrales bacterium]|nr:phosphodiester glycosidase family protein [Candidatus Acidoferrales bacterium]